MQNNPQELSWQAIQTIVGVKLPLTVLRFDEIGFHLIKHSDANVIELDSDVEIIENDSDMDHVSSLEDANGTDNGECCSPEKEIFVDSPIKQIEEKHAKTNGLNIPSLEDYSCSICEEKFSSKIDLSKHYSQTHSEDNDNSNDNNLSIDDYLEVTLSTDSENGHCCNRCDQIFPTEVALSSHQCTPKLQLTDEKKHPCHMCTEKFTNYWELRKHINTHFPGMLDSKSSFCHLCQKDYTKTGFMNHLRKHTGERPFVCELCHKAFSQSSSLSIHMKFHLNVRKHACTMCEKKFVTKSELSRHMTVHTKQKSYYCGVCDKAFTRSDNMKKHEKTHG